MIDWLFGTVLGKCVMTFLISLLPVVELRGGIPYGISQVCNKFIKHPSEAVSVGDVVRVAVLEVDEKRKRISLTMRGVPKDGETGPDCQKTAR